MTWRKSRKTTHCDLQWNGDRRNSEEPVHHRRSPQRRSMSFPGAVNKDRLERDHDIDVVEVILIEDGYIRYKTEQKACIERVKRLTHVLHIEPAIRKQDVRHPECSGLGKGQCHRKN